jgi:hypothetical protein
MEKNELYIWDYCLSICLSTSTKLGLLGHRLDAQCYAPRPLEQANEDALAELLWRAQGPTADGSRQQSETRWGENYFIISINEKSIKTN